MLIAPADELLCLLATAGFPDLLFSAEVAAAFAGSAMLVI
jgi:hypothetical protein